MKTLKRILRVIIMATAGLAVLLVLIAGLTQTQLFRDRIRAFALAQLDSLLIADVTLGEVRGNLVTGFAVDGVTMTLDGDTLLHAGQLNIRYNIFEVPGKTIAVHSVILERPVVRLLRSRSGAWNIDRIAAPADEDTTSSRFDWAVDLRNLELRDGSVLMVDSTTLHDPDDPGRPPGAIDYDRVELQDVTLALAFSMKNDVIRANIRRFSADIAGTPMRLRQMSGAFEVTPHHASVADLHILTDSSDVTVHAHLDSTDLFGGMTLEGLRQCSTMVDLTIEPLHCGEFGRILPSVSFLQGRITGHLRAEGPFGALPVRTLDLAFGQSRLHLDGTVRNLHRPEDLALDVHLHETVIDPADPLALMPSFDLPDFRSVGPVAFDLTYRGTPLDFRTSMIAETAAGTFAAEDLRLIIGGPHTLRYEGTIGMQHVDLSRILDQEELATDLNGTATVDGTGVDLKRIRGSAEVRLDSSTFRGLAISNAEGRVRAAARKVEGSLHLGISRAVYDLTATLDESVEPLPVFSVTGNASGVDLAELTGEARHGSDLTMELSLHGRGLTLATLNGEFHFGVTNSRYADYPIEDGDVSIVLDQSDSTAKSLAITSPALDVALSGRFGLENLARLVRFQVNNAALAVSESFAPFDSTFQFAVDTVALAALRAGLERDRERVDCRYDLKVKDLQLVSRIVGERSFDGVADLTGTLRGDITALTSTTRLGVKEFYYGDVAAGLLIEDGSVTIEATDLGPDRNWADADIHLQTTARMIDISSTELDSIEVDVRLKDREAAYLVRGALDHEVRVAMQGEATLRGDTIACSVDAFEAAYRDFRWEALPGADLAIAAHGVTLGGLILTRDDARVAVDGTVGPAAALDVTFRGTDLDLADLGYLLPEVEQSSGERAFEGVMDADMRMGGTLDAPTFASTIAADSIALRGIPFGMIRGTAGYGGGVLDLAIAADVTRGRVADGPELTAEGSIPLRFGDGEPADDRRQFKLQIRSAGTPIAILDPLLPNFNDLTGMLECDLTIGGTAGHPRYAGRVRLSECQFLFEANNMYYIVDGTFEASGDRIRVQQATVRNVPGDETKGRPGLVQVGGDFALRNFTPGDFNLTATGQLHVVKEATRKSALSMYGNLFAQIGEGGLRFTGNIEQSLLRGRILIRDSDLIFPPTQQVVEEESALSVPIIIYDDTSKYGEKDVLSAADRYFGTGGVDGGNRVIKNIEGAVSFLDGLRYDLDIDATGGSTGIRMIFNPISSEELVATIDGRFSITRDGRWWLGDLAVSRAYYNFYRRFDAEGRIQFTGDFMNPELDIRATYRGTRAVRDTVSDKDERIEVIVDIDGPRSSPRLTMNMTIEDVDYHAYNGLKSNDVQSDAIGFIIYGSFPLTMAQRGEVSAEVERTFRRSVLTGASSLLTGTLSEFLRAQTGFISSVELNFNTQAGANESADIRLSGQAWSGYWRYGGQILDDPLGNANFSVLYSFGTIFNTPVLRNFMMELESKVERGTFGQVYDLKRTNSARFFYRFSF